MPSLHTPIASLLTTLLERLQSILGPDLVGLYLRGSLVTGDFEPGRSDIDLLAVTEKPLNDGKFVQLKALHNKISTFDNPYARRIEIAYIDRHNLRKYQPGQKHPTLGQGEELSWKVHGSNWMLERWMLREHGQTLIGPDLKTLLDPVPPWDIKLAVVSRVVDWADWAHDEDDSDWKLPLSHKAYAIETMCRILYTANHGIIANKADSVDWALASIPKPWRELVNRSQKWRMDTHVDPSINPDVRAFILWTTRQVKEMLRKDSRWEEKAE